MPDENESAKAQLLSLLRERQAVLMVGAGSSKFAGYPLWEELVEDLRRQFAPSLRGLAEGQDPAEYANAILAQIEQDQRSREYHKHLERLFEPRVAGATYDEMHQLLVKLDFRGVVTTNYDRVMEAAIIDVLRERNDTYTPHCASIDLCNQEQSHRVSGFLRQLSSTSGNFRSVLHLHGFYENPANIVLAKNDYLKKYGELTLDEKKTQVPLDKLHRKVIWALLATHPVVFVGFGMKDPFFMALLEVVKEDLNLEGDTLHYAILPSSDEDSARILKRKYTVQPVFYPIRNVGVVGSSPDHGALKELIFEFAEKAGIQTGSPSAASITARMLER